MDGNETPLPPAENVVERDLESLEIKPSVELAEDPPVLVPQFRHDSVPLADLIAKVVHRTNQELHTLIETFPSKSDVARKQELYKFSVYTRQLFTKLLVLERWSQKHASELATVEDVIKFLVTQDDLITWGAFWLAEKESEVRKAREPNYDLPTAIEMLTKGTYDRLPSIISEQLLPRKPPSDDDQKCAIRLVEDTMATMIAFSELVPTRLRRGYLGIEAGRAKFRVEGEFEVTLTLVPRDPQNPPIVGQGVSTPPEREDDRAKVLWTWYVVEVDILVHSDGVPDFRSDRRLRDELRHGAQCRLDAACALSQILEDAHNDGADMSAAFPDSDGASFAGSAVSASFRLPPVQQKQLQQLRQFQASQPAFRTTSNPAAPLRRTKWPMVELYDYLHTKALIQQIEVLHALTIRLQETRWKGEAEAERSSDEWNNPVLRVWYWSTPAVGLGGVSKSDPTPLDRRKRKRNVLEISLRMPRNESLRPATKPKPPKRVEEDEFEFLETETEPPTSGPENLFGREKPSLIPEPRFLAEAEIELDAHVIRAMRPSIRTLDAESANAADDRRYGPCVSNYDSFLAVRAYIPRDYRPYVAARQVDEQLVEADFVVDSTNLSLETLLAAAARAACHSFLRKLRVMFENAHFLVGDVSTLDGLQVAYAKGKMVRISMDTIVGQASVTLSGDNPGSSMTPGGRIGTRMDALAGIINGDAPDRPEFAGKLIETLTDMGCETLIDRVESFGVLVGLRPHRQLLQASSDFIRGLSSPEANLPAVYDGWEERNADFSQHLLYLQFPRFPEWYLTIRVSALKNTPEGQSFDTGDTNRLLFGYSAWLLRVRSPFTSSNEASTTALFDETEVRDSQVIDLEAVERMLVGVAQSGDHADVDIADGKLADEMLEDRGSDILESSFKKRKRQVSEPAHDSAFKRPRLGEGIEGYEPEPWDRADGVNRVVEGAVKGLDSRPVGRPYISSSDALPLQILSCVEGLSRRRIAYAAMEEQLQEHSLRWKYVPSNLPTATGFPFAALGTLSMRVEMLDATQAIQTTSADLSDPDDASWLHDSSGVTDGSVGARTARRTFASSKFAQLYELHVHAYDDARADLGGSASEPAVRVVACLRARTKSRLAHSALFGDKLGGSQFQTSIKWHHMGLDGVVLWLLSKIKGLAFLVDIVLQARQNFESLRALQFELHSYSESALEMRYSGEADSVRQYSLKVRWQDSTEMHLPVGETNLQSTGVNGLVPTGLEKFGRCVVVFDVADEERCGDADGNPHSILAGAFSTKLMHDPNIVRGALFIRQTFPVLSLINAFQPQSANLPGRRTFVARPLSLRAVTLVVPETDCALDLVFMTTRTCGLFDASFEFPWHERSQSMTRARIPGVGRLVQDVCAYLGRPREGPLNDSDSVRSLSFLPLPMGLLLPFQLVPRAFDRMESILRVILSTASFASQRGSGGAVGMTQTPHLASVQDGLGSGSIPSSDRRLSLPEGVQVVLDLDNHAVRLRVDMFCCEFHLLLDSVSDATWRAKISLEDDAKWTSLRTSVPSNDVHKRLSDFGDRITRKIKNARDIRSQMVSLAHVLLLPPDTLLDICELCAFETEPDDSSLAVNGSAGPMFEVLLFAEDGVPEYVALSGEPTICVDPTLGRVTFVIRCRETAPVAPEIPVRSVILPCAHNWRSKVTVARSGAVDPAYELTQIPSVDDVRNDIKTKIPTFHYLKVGTWGQTPVLMVERLFMIITTYAGTKEEEKRLPKLFAKLRDSWGDFDKEEGKKG